jgi:hypothetical protein
VVVRNIASELSFHLMTMVKPVIQITFVTKQLEPNNVDDAKMVTFTNFDVLLVVVYGKNEVGNAFVHKENIRNFITFFENILSFIEELRLKLLNYPSNKRLRSVSEILNVFVPMMKNYLGKFVL